jgi:predicted metalloendopeptidase
MVRKQSTGVLLFGILLSWLLTAKATAEPQVQRTAVPSGPTVNFYEWVNRDWLDSTTIPSDKPGISNFEVIQHDVNLRLEKLLDELKAKSDKTADERKIVTLYDSITDLARRETLGLSPIRQELLLIDRAGSLRDIALLFAQLERIGVPAPVIIDVSTDFKDSGRNIIFLEQSGLGIERDDLIGKDERSQNLRRQYRTLLAELFRLASVAQPDARAAEVLALEQELARIQWSKTDNRNLDLMSNVTDYANLMAKTPGLYIDDQFTLLGIPSGYPVNLTQPSYLQAFSRFFPSRNVETWKIYLKARLLITYGKLLDGQFRKTLVDYEIRRGLYEIEEPLPLQAIGYMNGNAGLLLGKFYVEHTFSDNDKSKVAGIVKSIVDQYRVAINTSMRMAPETRRKALEKIDHMTFRIGYPDRWKDYVAFRPVPGQPAENHKRLSRFEFEHHLARLGNPVDNSDWNYPPQVVNAFYDPTSNSFVLLAAILNPPFYSSDASDAKIFGGIGFVIGHEIGHGFDDQGSRFDDRGNLKNWWTKPDAERFDAIKRRLIAQANAYEILPGKHLNGTLEIGEIIGDLSGAEISFGAYMKSAAPAGGDSTKNRRDYFEQLARTWRAKMRPDFTLLLLDADPHPPSEYRANGIVKNINEFHELFGTKKGDPMYLPPEQRITMW